MIISMFIQNEKLKFPCKSYGRPSFDRDVDKIVILLYFVKKDG